MKIIAFNGSPSKEWNTATLLQKALEGAASQGAKTELIHLSDLNYKARNSLFSFLDLGILSCFLYKPLSFNTNP